MEVFKAYDVRGKYGEGIDTDFAYILGRGIARFIRGEKIMIGYDARTHSGALYRALAQGLVCEGKSVKGIGLTSTPCLHYMQVTSGYDGGVMVTASHNPPEYHGFKVFDATGGSVSLEKGLSIIRDMIPDLKHEPPGKTPAYGKGSFFEDKNTGVYTDFLSSAWGKKPCNIKIVIDISNGSAGGVFGEMAGALDLPLVLINAEPDGSFPNHNPNPLKKESSVQVARVVKEENAAAGAILDGDGDRVLFVDEKGDVVKNYFMAALFAGELFNTYPGSPVVYDLISSRVLPERIKELGGVPVVSKVGYTNLYDKMIETKAIFGAEASGHAYFKVTDNYYTESAAYAVLLLLNLLMRKKEPLSRLTNPLRAKYFQADEVNTHVADKKAAMERVAEHYKDYDIQTLDGISIDAGNFWFNLRPSNTEPLLRLRLEAESSEVALEKVTEIKRLMQGV